MEFDFAVSALRVLFLFLVPMIVVVVASGVLAGALQTATAIKEPALGYAVRLIAVLAALYLVLPGTYQSLAELLTVALR